MFNNFLNQLFILFLSLLSFTVVFYFIKFIRAKVIFINEKIKNEKINFYINLAENVVETTVIVIAQTFVDSLRKEGKFDKKAQEIAFNNAKTVVLNTLNQQTKIFLIKLMEI